MVEMIWKEPPPVVSSEKAQILAELQKHPGRWALVQAGYKSTSGAAIWKKLGCEATHRRTETKGAYDIYARWPEPLPQKAAKPVEEAIRTGTAIKPAPGGIIKPPNDFGMSSFRAARERRGVPDEGLPVEALRR